MICNTWPFIPRWQTGIVETKHTFLMLSLRVYLPVLVKVTSVQAKNLIYVVDLCFLCFKILYTCY